MLSGSREPSSEAWGWREACPELVDGRQGVALGLWWGTDRIWVPELLWGGDEITFSPTLCHSQPPPIPSAQALGGK